MAVSTRLPARARAAARTRFAMQTPSEEVVFTGRSAYTAALQESFSKAACLKHSPLQASRFPIKTPSLAPPTSAYVRSRTYSTGARTAAITAAAAAATRSARTAAATNTAGGGIRRAIGTAAGQPSTPWPNARFWLRHEKDGKFSNVIISAERPPSAQIAFDAYTTPKPGTKEMMLGGSRFYPFLAPRLGCEHFVVWRRLQDVRNLAQDVSKLFDLSSADYPIRVTRACDHEQLTSPVYSWTEAGKRVASRYWASEGENWIYWTSFWAPAEKAERALDFPAFGDEQGRMLAPLLESPTLLPAPECPQQRSLGITGDAVPSTAAGVTPKDQAYSVIYACNVWGSDHSRSGTGSDLWSPEARLAATALDAVVDHYGFKSVLDCACGDATWMVPYFCDRHEDVSYCGVDVVPHVIAQNRQKHPQLRFEALDLAESPLPKGSELVFSKETLNHMPLPDAINAIQRFRETGAGYLLTNVHHNSVNEDGEGKTCYTTYVKYDYELPPFNLKRVSSILEYQGSGTSYSLYEL